MGALFERQNVLKKKTKKTSRMYHIFRKGSKVLDSLSLESTRVKKKKGEKKRASLPFLPFAEVDTDRERLLCLADILFP